MKLSEVTDAVVREYLRLPESGEDTALSVIMEAARNYILGYTGLSAEDADQYEDLTIAFLVLCSDMYDNRQMQVDGGNVNRVAQSILNLHCRNLL